MKSILIKYNIIQLFTFTFFVTAFLNTAIAQPAKKSVFTFPTTIGPNESEDWPYSIFMSSDCIHLYFAGFNEIFPAGCSIKLQAPVIGKFNTITNTLVWEKTYFAMDNNNVTYQSRGTFWSIFEYNGEIIATGNQGKDQCSNVEAQNMFPMILKADAITGIAHSGYPKFIDAGTDKKLNFIFPFTENGTVTGIYGLGSTDDNKSVISFLNSDGTVNTNLGNQGYFIGPEKVELKRMIKVSGLPDVKYAFIGTKKHNANDWDVYVGGLNVDGNTLIWAKEFSETSLIGSNIYVDNPVGDSPLCSEIPETGLEGWENNVYEEGWDLKQLGTDLFLSCKFDFVLIDFPKPCNGFNSILNGNSKYEYIDMALVKIGANDGVYESAINIGTSDAPDFFPEIEIVDGKVTILGARSSIYDVNGQKRLKTDGKLTTYDSDLSFVEERLFSTEGWDINCSFDMAFNCEGELFVTGNNDKNDEDYYFYKFSNGCQKYSKYVSTDEKVNRTISQQETWSSSKKVGAKITIQSGGILTINNNAVIEFGASWDLIDYDKLSQNNSTDKTPKIVIESGGRLNLNGCTLRGMIACSSNGMWDGVEVQNGGMVTSNGATIQDARFGILADKGSYNSYGNLGGTETNGGANLQLNGGQILNCRRGIHFASCPSNASSITGVEFISNDFLKDPSYKSYMPNNQAPFSKTQKLGTSIFVSANSVGSKIFINGGSIVNSAILPVSLRGTGISQFKSQMDVFGMSFTNLNYAIFGNSSNSPRFMTISNGTFGSNYTGILFRGGTLHAVDNSTFNCTYPIVPGQNSVLGGIGVYNSGTTKTVFNDNTFTAGTNPAGTYGIISENTGSANTTHKTNHFSTMFRGDQTQRLNSGLNLWCNDYTNTDKAWAINITTAGSGAFKDQGECGINRKLFPDNKFKDICNSSLIDIHSNLGFTYWKNSSESDPPELPCSQNVTLKIINSQQDCNINLDPTSGCNAIIPITGLNDDYYYDLVPTLPDGDHRQGIVNDLIRYYTGTNETERISTLLQNESNENYKMSYAELLLDQGNISGAITVANSFNNSSPEASDYLTFFGVLVYAKQNNLKLDQLPQSKIQLLESISANRTIGAYNAQAILSSYYGYNFPLIVETESGLEYREKAEVKKELNLQLTTLVPNPTNHSVIISTNNKNKFITSVGIMSIEGRELMRINFRGSNSSEKIDLTQLNQGIYIIKIDTNSGLNPELIKLIKQ